MTDKIGITKYAIYDAIQQYINFEDEDLFVVLESGVMTIEKFVDEIVMELIRYAYDQVLPKESIRSLLAENNMKDDDSKKAAYGRIREYVQRYRDREADVYAGLFGEYPEELKAMSMESIEEKLSGYRLNKMQFFEMTQLQDLRILKSMVEHRLDDNKKVSNAKFLELFEEYEAFVDSLELTEDMSDEEVVFNSVAYWVLEWKYPFEMFYKSVLVMEEKGLDHTEPGAMCIMGGLYQISRGNGTSSGHSRFIRRRNEFAESIVCTEETMSIENVAMAYSLEEYIHIKNIMLQQYCFNVDENLLLKDWFVKETAIHDWAEFLREYNIFQIRQKKEWNSKRIRQFRELIRISTI